MQDEGSLDSSSLKACQNKSQIECFCMQCFCSFAVKRMKFKTTLVFWIFLVVVFSFMDSHKDMNVNKFRIPTTKHFFKWGKCETFKGVNCVVY